MTVTSIRNRRHAPLPLLAAVSALVLATPGQATDLGFLTRAEDKDLGPVSWTGFIFNPDVGYDTLKLGGPAGSLVDDAKGWKAGLEIGYDYQIGDVVVGVVADGFYSWMDGEDGPVESDLKYFGTLRGRLGYSYGRFLAYATGGWAFGDLEITDRLADLSDSQKLSGWAAGGGLEYVWNKSLTARVEYVHVDFGDETYDSLPVGNDRLSAEMDLVKFGLITRF